MKPFTERMYTLQAPGTQARFSYSDDEFFQGVFSGDSITGPIEDSSIGVEWLLIWPDGFRWNVREELFLFEEQNKQVY